jgi:hypothetical protein
MISRNAIVGFSCGDIAYVQVLEADDNEVCVRMDYGPIWVPRHRVSFFS